MTSVMRKLEIPSAIVGRDEEIHQIRQVLASVTNSESSDAVNTSSLRRSIYVSGVSGVGKSALVEAALANEATYFCRGKFDAIVQDHHPFAPVIDCLNALCSQALRQHQNSAQNQNDLDIIRREIARNIPADDIRKLRKLIRSLKPLFQDGGDEDAASLSSKSSTTSSSIAKFQSLRKGFERIKTTFTSLIDAIVLPRETLVIFMDDMQWANTEALGIIDEVLEKGKTNVLFVCGFRSDEIDQDHLVTHHMNSISEKVVIHLKPLSMDDVTSFVAQTLIREETDVIDLVGLIFKKTSGNIFFVRQYLEFLYRSGHLYYSVSTFLWEWDDIPTIQEAEAFDGNIEAIVCKKIITLPTPTIEVLKLASCLGNRFDIDVIEEIATMWWKDNSARLVDAERSNPIAEILWDAVELGLLEELSSDPFSSAITYKFVHDKVQTASYLLIGKATKKYHLDLGHYLLRLHDLDDSTAWMLVAAADHLFKGETLVQAQEDRDEMATVCYRAAEELKSIAAFKTAALVAKNALYLIGENCWQRNYSLSLNIHKLSAEVAFCSGDEKGCDANIDLILEHAKTLDDKQTALALHIENLGCSGHHEQAFAAGVNALRKLKMGRIPKTVGISHLLPEILRTLSLLRKMSERELINLKTTEDYRMDLYGKVLLSTALFAYFAHYREAFAFLIIRNLRLSLKQGYTSTTAPGFVVCAMAAAKLGKLEESRRLRRVAVAISERFDAPDVDCITFNIYHVMTTPIFEPIGVNGVNMGKTYAALLKMGISSGNVSGECLNAVACLVFSFWEGSVRLDRLASLAAQYRDKQIAEGRDYHLSTMRMTRQLILKLVRPSSNPTVLQGDEIRDPTEFMKGLGRADREIFKYNCLQLNSFFCNWKESRKLALFYEKHGTSERPVYFSTIGDFWSTLAWINLYKDCRKYAWKRRAMNGVRMIQGQVAKGLANRKLFGLILEAELRAHVYKEQPLEEVRELYDLAIDEAERAGWLHFAAFGSELAGDYFWEKDQDETARLYFRKAIEGYSGWRALGKVSYILSKYDLDPVDFSTDALSTSMELSSARVN